MTSTKHSTPGPWVVDTERTGCVIRPTNAQRKGHRIAHNLTRGDAVFIVAACNVHAELVSALREIVAEFDSMNAARDDANKLGDTPAVSNARAVLGRVQS